VGALVEAVDGVDVLEEARRGEAGPTANVEDAVVGGEVEQLDCLVARGTCRRRAPVPCPRVRPSPPASVVAGITLRIPFRRCGGRDHESAGNGAREDAEATAQL
jgi:hypothetical protein